MRTGDKPVLTSVDRMSTIDPGKERRDVQFLKKRRELKMAVVKACRELARHESCNAFSFKIPESPMYVVFGDKPFIDEGCE